MSVELSLKELRERCCLLLKVNSLADRLSDRLKNDLIRIGFDRKLVESVEIEIKDYSKTYYGRYLPAKKKIVIYRYKNSGEEYSYDELLKVAMHEMIHAQQWSNPEFKRVKGVMHDVEFKRLMNQYTFAYDNLKR